MSINITITGTQVYLVLVIIAVLVGTIVALLMQMHANKRIINAALAVSDSAEDQRNEYGIALDKERSINKMLCEILFDLANNSRSAEIVNWKLFMIRQVQDMLKLDPETRESESGYEMIMNILNSKSPVTFLEKMRYITRGYYIMDMEKGADILKMFDTLIDKEAKLNAAKHVVNVSTSVANMRLERAKMNINIERASSDMPKDKRWNKINKIEDKSIYEQFIEIADKINEDITNFENPSDFDPKLPDKQTEIVPVTDYDATDAEYSESAVATESTPSEVIASIENGDIVVIKNNKK